MVEDTLISVTHFTRALYETNDEDIKLSHYLFL